MADRIGIVDYGMGNVGSVKRKLELLDIPFIVSNDPNELDSVSKLILPGVGHFSKAVQSLKKLGLWEFLDVRVRIQNTPILGICLGMQLMAKCSEEGEVNGFGWIEGKVKRFQIQDTIKYKVPHIGWNTIDINKNHPILEGIEPNCSFYFVHGYYIECKNYEDILCSTNYERSFTSAIQKGNIFGFQFHPEKSHDSGVKLLENFTSL